MECILTCHNRKSTGINNEIKYLRIPFKCCSFRVLVLWAKSLLICYLVHYIYPPPFYLSVRILSKKCMHDIVSWKIPTMEQKTQCLWQVHYCLLPSHNAMSSRRVNNRTWPLLMFSVTRAFLFLSSFYLYLTDNTCAFLWQVNISSVKKGESEKMYKIQSTVIP